MHAVWREVIDGHINEMSVAGTIMPQPVDDHPPAGYQYFMHTVRLYATRHHLLTAIAT